VHKADSTWLAFQALQHTCLEFRDIFSRDLPHNREVYTQIIVDQQIAKAGDSAPIDIRLAGPEPVREALRGFSG